MGLFQQQTQFLLTLFPGSACRTGGATLYYESVGDPTIAPLVDLTIARVVCPINCLFYIRYPLIT